MSWLIAALGLVLVVAGGASIVSGVPYMRLEFGWTEVIAGTTALSAGVVTLALAAMLVAVQSLRRALLVSGPASSGMAIRTVQPFHPADPTATADPDIAIPVPSSRPVMPRAASLTSGKVVATGPQEPRTDTVQPAEPNPRAFPTPTLAPLRPTVPPVDVPAGHSAGPEPARSIGTKLPAPAEDDAVAAPARSVEPAPSSDIDAPTVVGRYESGGASYVLFSDGTIEVETEAGTHRFTSMQDLKDHIARQEQA